MEEQAEEASRVWPALLTLTPYLTITSNFPNNFYNSDGFRLVKKGLTADPLGWLILYYYSHGLQFVWLAFSIDFDYLFPFLSSLSRDKAILFILQFFLINNDLRLFHHIFNDKVKNIYLKEYHISINTLILFNYKHKNKIPYYILNFSSGPHIFLRLFSTFLSFSSLSFWMKIEFHPYKNSNFMTVFLYSVYI